MNKLSILSGLVASILILQGLLVVPVQAQTVGQGGGAQGIRQPAYCLQFGYLYRGLSDYRAGGQVSALQQFLTTQGFYQPVTGYFGSITAANVVAFQRAQGVYPLTGGVGPLTRAAIARLCGGGAPTPQTPVIYSTTPAQGPIGTQITIMGAGFGSNNVIHFDVGGKMQVPSFNNGTVLYFTIPPTVSGCDIIQTFAVCAQYVKQVQPGTYQLYVTNESGQSSNSVAFTVTGTQTVSGLTAAPTQGPAPLAVSFTGTVPNSTTYIVDYGDGQTSGPLQATCLSNQPYPGYGYGAYNCGVSASHTYGTAGTYTATLSQYIGCLYSNPRCMVAQPAPIGSATIVVQGSQTVGGLTVTSPTAGQSYARGSSMQISWSYPVTPGSASMVLDLYTAAGGKVGTIAVSTDTIGSYTWRVPPFPNNLFCTMQYPNGLCGTNIVPGQYYIRVSAVSGNGLDTSAPVIASGQSGVFSVY